MLDFVEKNYKKEQNKNNHFLKSFEEAWSEYCSLEPFAPDENVWEVRDGISDEAHYIMRLVVQYMLTETFKAMKIDMTNVNVAPNTEEGNIGTPGRIAKMWLGANTEDNTELLSGRWMKEPRMAAFKKGDESGEVVWVETSLRGVCSHHLISFNDDAGDEESKVVIGYVVKDGVRGGISKINRYVRDYAARRMWLQEDLCTYIGKTIEKGFKTDSVYVGMFKIKHGCASLRGACDINAGTSTIYKSGDFKTQDIIPEKYKG